MPSTISSRRQKAESGQGIVEYILLIVVVIAMALAVMNTFFKPFNKWAKNYIGDYIFCLLDQGELPALGGEDAASECAQQFNAYTFEEGRSRKSGSEESSSSSKSNLGSRSRLGNKSNASGVSAARRGSSRTSSSLGSGFDNGAGGAAAGKITDVTGQFSKKSAYFRGRSGRWGGSSGGGRTSVYNGISGYLTQEAERVKKREDKVRAVGKSGEMATAFARGRNKLPTEMPVIKKRGEELDITAGEWSFGAMFRILLIIVILIALALFVAGQVAQISKSLEKSE